MNVFKERNGYRSFVPYNVEHTVAVKNGNLIIPHKDHYHNIKFAWFDDKTYRAPNGYTLEDLFATIKSMLNIQMSDHSLAWMGMQGISVFR